MYNMRAQLVPILWGCWGIKWGLILSASAAGGSHTHFRSELPTGIYGRNLVLLLHLGLQSVTLLTSYRAAAKSLKSLVIWCSQPPLGKEHLCKLCQREAHTPLAWPSGASSLLAWE